MKMPVGFAVEDHEALEKSNGLKLVSRCLHPSEMSYITSRDIYFVHRDVTKVTPETIFTCIQWPSGQRQYGHIQIADNTLREMVRDSVGGTFGPTHILIQHFDHYGTADGPSVWLIGFYSNAILAQRYALMSEKEFRFLCGPWADWDMLMSGKAGKLPHIY